MGFPLLSANDTVPVARLTEATRTPVLRVIWLSFSCTVTGTPEGFAVTIRLSLKGISAWGEAVTRIILSLKTCRRTALVFPLCSSFGKIITPSARVLYLPSWAFSDTAEQKMNKNKHNILILTVPGKEAFI
jgi:hypothetical protein